MGKLKEVAHKFSQQTKKETTWREKMVKAANHLMMEQSTEHQLGNEEGSYERIVEELNAKLERVREKAFEQRKVMGLQRNMLKKAQDNYSHEKVKLTEMESRLKGG